MFHGSIPQDMRNIIKEMVAGWDVNDIYVGCSGNFTVERVLAESGRFTIHGNDVTIYSCTIGSYLAGETHAMHIKPEFEEKFGWLRPYMEDGAGRVATTMLTTRLLEGLNAKGEWKENAYYDRILPAFRLQWDALYSKTRDKVDNADISLGSFYAGDVVDYVDNLPDDAGFIAYFPFFSGDYEAMFAKLDMIFDWQQPEFTDIGGGNIKHMLDKVMDRPCWAFGSHKRLDEYEPYLKGMTQTTNRGVSIYVYSNNAPRRVVVPHQQTESVLVERLTPGQDIGDELAIIPLSDPQFKALRSQYMNPGIKPGQASAAYGVLVDGKVIGCFALSAAPSKGKTNYAEVYLLSDFPVEPSSYKRLSKLVLYAALSKETKRIAERLTRRRIRRVLTTAFSNNPVSMKYRGLFDVRSRKQNPNWSHDTVRDYYNQRYMINYVAPIGEWTLAEGLALWKKKHAKHRYD